MFSLDTSRPESSRRVATRPVHLAERDGEAQAIASSLRLRSTAVRPDGQRQGISMCAVGAQQLQQQAHDRIRKRTGPSAARSNHHVRPCVRLQRRCAHPARVTPRVCRPGRARVQSDQTNRRKTRSAPLPVRRATLVQLGTRECQFPCGGRAVPSRIAHGIGRA